MLTPQQVIPFLGHDDPEVRLQAVLYLAGAHDPAPATADDFWRAIDKLGTEQAATHVARLELIPQTDDSVARTLAAIPTASGDARSDLVRVLRSLDFPLLQRHADAIRAVAEVPQDVKEHVEQRLALADEPVEPLWDRLMEQAAALNDKDLTENDALAAERLIEALARRPDLFGDRAVEMLRDPAVKDWREVFMADLVGELKRVDAVDALLDELRDDDGDLLWETAGEALVRLADPAVVARTAERFGQEEWGFRVSAAGVLGRFKLPEAEAALLRLIGAEQDREVLTFLVSSLLDLCPTDEAALEAARQIVLKARYEPGTADVKALLLTVGTMVGYEPAEAEAWRQQIARERERWERGDTDDAGLMAAGMQALAPDVGDAFLPISPTGQMFGLSDPRPLPPPSPLRTGRGSRRHTGAGRRGATTYAPAQKAPPIRRPTKKVGRNDPCPCGSGKKYKKCCMKD